MRTGRNSTGLFWIFLAVVALIGLVILVISTSQPKQSEVQQAQTDQPVALPKVKIPDNVIGISIASSNTKEDWLREATAKFNQASKTEENFQVNGKPVLVTILQETIDGKKKDYRSGAMVGDIIKKKIQPTIVSPGEESWVEKLKKEWQIQESGQLISGDSPILVRSPLVIATWKSRAIAMKAWPNGPGANWETLKDLAQQGWKKFNHPEWGKLKIGYGYWGESNSGTLAIISMCTVGAKKNRLDFDDIKSDAPAGKFLAEIEKSKVHSGKSDVWLLEKMIHGGQEYLDAVVTYESNVIMMNRKFEKDLREPLVCLYPQDGTVIVGHPFAILDRAPWVTEDQTQAAKIFQNFLLDKDQQEQVLSAGLRPADSGVKLGFPFDVSLGVNPNVKIKEISIPEQILIDRVGEVWHKVKKHSIIALVFDKSGSMGGSSLSYATKGAIEFVNRIDSEDTIMWMPFDSNSYGVLVEGTKEKIGERLIGEYINGLTAEGGTALYDTILEAHQRLTKIREQKGDAYRYGIVALTDGDDQGSDSNLTDVESQLQKTESDSTGIQIFTIGIGEAKQNVLKTIAAKGNGKFFKGTPAELGRIYAEIVTYY